MRKKKILPILFCSILMLFAVLYLAGLFYFRSHFLPNTKMNGIEVSFLNEKETGELLDLIPVKLTVKEKDREGKETISEELELISGQGMNLHYAMQKISHYQNPYLWFLSSFKEKRLSCDTIDGNYDKDTLNGMIDTLYCMQEENWSIPEAAHIAYENNELKIVEADDGSMITKETVLAKISEALDKALNGEKPDVIDLCDSYEKAPETRQEELERTLSSLQKVINKKITIVISENKTEMLEGEQLKELLVLQEDALIADTVKLESYAGRIVDQYSISSSEYIAKGPLKDALRKALPSEENVSIECEWVRETAARSDDLIEVSYSEQMLYYYRNGELVFSSPVVTGNEDTEIIPYGTYYVQHMKKNATLVSATYEEHVDYWIGFDFESGGHVLGFHDAQWRDAFGGDIWKTDPSHGCVNMPTDKVAMLYDAVDIGTEIHIHE
jgi:lipoprotein-anchoring transpeptidase ErfK/SrfK